MCISTCKKDASHGSVTSHTCSFSPSAEENEENQPCLWPMRVDALTIDLSYGVSNPRVHVKEVLFRAKIRENMACIHVL